MLTQDFSQLNPSPSWHDPILIVGANPVGLITALGLARNNIPSVVLEEGMGASLESDQVALLDPTTLEILDSWYGLGGLISSHGIIPQSQRVLLRKSTLSRAQLPAQQTGSPYPRQVNIHHADLEHILLQTLEQTGRCQVLWQHEVKGIVQDRTGIDVELNSPRGTKYLRAPYLLVTASPPTSIHTALGCAYSGEMSNERYLSLDIQAQLDDPTERWLWFNAPSNSGRITQIHPLPGNLARILYQLAPGEDLAAILQSASIQQRIESTLGNRPYEVIAVNTHPFRRGVIERFKSGRVLFLGGAAHRLTLLGLSEVNSGALDAWNLVWKLALVRAGLALEDLLDTYHDEQHAAALAAMEQTGALLSFLAPAAGLATWKRNTSLRLGRANATQHLYDSPARPTYRTSALFSDDHRLYLGGRFTKLSSEQNAILKRFRQRPAVGSLAPSLTLPDADTGAPVSLLARSNAGFLALCFTSDIDMAMRALTRIPMDMSEIPIDFYLVTPTMPAVPTQQGVTIVLDEQNWAASAYNAGPRTLYLVRPDRVIAARRFDSDFNDIPALLRHAIGEDVVDSQTRIPRPEIASTGY
jgi:2-polyprenyl-6-methoxyphenol hydroxylase-like FAD-dependent oxidoreductase